MKKRTNATKRQSLRKKLIALWVVFAMLVVPFSGSVSTEHVDEVKAEGTNIGQIVKTGEIQTIEETVKLNLTVADSNAYEPNLINSKTYTLAAGTQKLLVKNVTSDISTAKYGYKFYGVNETVDESISSTTETGLNVVADNTNESNINQTIDTTSDKKVLAIYASVDGTTYTLQYRVMVVFSESVFLGSDTIGIYNGESKISDSGYTNSATVKAKADSFSNEYAEIKYCFTEENADETSLKTASKYSDSTTISPEKNGKQVYAYAALISKSGSADEKVLEYVYLGSVKMDGTKPTINCDQVKEKSGDEYAAISSNYLDNNTYYGMADSYQYTLTIKDDGTGASGIGEVRAYLGDVEITTGNIQHDSTSNTYTITIPKSMLSGKTGESLIVTATDKAGNTTEYTCPTQIVQVTESTSVKSVVIDDNTDIKGLTGTYLIPKLASAKTITVTLESTKAGIDGVALNYKENNEEKTISSSPIKSSKVNKNRSYTVTATFAIPENVDATKLYESLVVGASVNGGSITVTDNAICSIQYDAVAPKITTAKLQEQKDGTNTWADSTDSITKLGYSYRYYVEVSEDVGIAGNESVKVGDRSFTYDSANSSNGTYTYNIPETDLPISGWQVTAADKAGNVSEKQNLPGLDKINKALEISGVKVLDASNKEVSSEVLKNKSLTNKQYKLQFTASSAYEITSMGVYANGQSYAVKEKASLGTQTADATTHRYSVTTEFNLPTNADINSLLDNMYVTATDANSTDSVVRYPEEGSYLGSVLYDQTQPIVTFANNAQPNAKGWYAAEPKVTYTVQSGDQSTESALASVTYGLSGCTEIKTNENVELDGVQTNIAPSITIPESSGASGTTLTVYAKDACGNESADSSTGNHEIRYTIKVDKTNPKINTFTVNGQTSLSEPQTGTVTIRSNVSDNLTIDAANLRVQGPNNIDKTISLKNGSSISLDHAINLSDMIGSTPDGNYTATVTVQDEAGHTASKTITFTVDNTIPVVTAKIVGGETAGKQPAKNYDGTTCDYYYRSNVSVLLTYTDDNMDASDVVVLDNSRVCSVQWTRVGNTNEYQATYVVSSDGGHSIQISATDNAGNEAAVKQVVFVRDTAAPTITAVINGGTVYSEAMGQLDMTANTTLSFSVSDANEDVWDFNYQLIKTVPDQNPVTADVIQTDNRTFGYTDEAEYIVKVYAIDKAGNRSAERTIQFRIDNTAPDLKISGASSGTALSSGTTVTFSMTEAFWWDASGTVTITRKARDGAEESAYKTIDFKPTGRTTNMTETLSETGEYTITFTAKDRAGHTSEATSYTVKIDTESPVITLNGVKNNDKTTGQVEFTAEISEDFYLTKSVHIEATRTYLDTESYKEKTENLTFTGYNPASETTIIRDTFSEDGLYKIAITCKDAAGNEDVQEVSFTIDKTAPVIDPEVLAAYEGTLTAFAWDYDLDDIVYDLTVCDVHMYLNGSEYDGTSEVEDGVYEMKIVAEDELGNKTEETVNFTLDTKAPTFIVTGVEDGEVKNAQYDISVSLQLEEDTLDSVALNGKALTITDNQATVSVTEKGDYTLTMKASDAAGNEAEQTISFTYGEKSHIWIYIVIGVAALVVIGGIIFVIAKKRSKDDEA